MTPYRLIEHTADGGLVIEAANAEALFAEAALALADQVVDRRSLRAVESRTVTAEAMDWTDLMINWLREVLYLMNGEQWLVKEAAVETLSETRLSARLAGESFDPARHALKSEIKAVTYHQARVDHQGGLWRARVILDL